MEAIKDQCISCGEKLVQGFCFNDDCIKNKDVEPIEVNLPDLDAPPIRGI